MKQHQHEGLFVLQSHKYPLLYIDEKGAKRLRQGSKGQRGMPGYCLPANKRT